MLGRYALAVSVLLLLLLGTVLANEQPANLNEQIELRNANISLIGGNGFNFGYVRVYYEVNGQYGFVCDNNFDDMDAKVVCRQLGFPSGTATAVTQYGPLPQGSFFGLDNVNCTGTEPSILNCRHSGWGNTNCGVTEGAGVICRQECVKPPLSSIKLVGQFAGNGEGNVQVTDLASGQVGYMCDNGWGAPEATVVCRQLGFSSGTVTFASYFGNIPTPEYVMDYVGCTGSEKDLLECKFNGWRVHTCSGLGRAGGVRCA